LRALAEKIKPVMLIIKSDHNLPSLGIAVFTLYAITQRLLDLYSNIRVFDITVVRVFELLLFSFSLLCLLFGRHDQQKFVKSFTGIDLFWFAAIIYIIISMFYVNADRYDYFIYIAVFIFLFFAKTDINDFSKAFLFIKYGAVFYAAGTLVQFIIPEQFNNFILMLVPKYSLDLLASRVAANYYPGFGFNQLAIAPNYISIGLGLTLAFWDANHTRVIKSSILLIVLFAALFIAGNRSFFLWTIVAFYLTYIASSSGHEAIRRAIKASVAVLGLAVIAFMINYFFAEMPLFARLQLLLSEVIYRDVNGSLAIRLSLYQDAWSVFLNNPWFGIGWDQFMLIHDSGFRVHNIILQILAETGIVGFLLIMPAIIYSYIITYKAMRYSIGRVGTTSSFWTKALSLSFYYQTVFLLSSLSDTIFYRTPFLLMYFLTLAIVNSYIYLQRNFEPG